MFQYLEGISKVMIVDFDAHQGNGHERDFINEEKVYIMDMYNRWIYQMTERPKVSCTGWVRYYSSLYCTVYKINNYQWFIDQDVKVILMMKTSVEFLQCALYNLPHT